MRMIRNFNTSRQVHPCMSILLGLALSALLANLATPVKALPQASFRIVALGASNTYSKGVSRAESYPVQLQTLLQKKGIPATVTNAGMNGDTTGGMLNRLSSDVPEGTDLVILQPGGNDRRKGLEGMRARNILEIRRRLEARGIRVVMMENNLFRAMPQTERAADGQHFTPRGYALLAERILPHVQNAFQN
jgi:acyl-CoA thioesterase I